MINQQVKSIINTGIIKYAALNNTEEENVQIFITDADEQSLNYSIAINWQPGQKVSFTDIMDKKIDFLGKEMILIPFIKKSMYELAQLHNAEIQDISFFMYQYEAEIAIAVYNKQTNVKTMTLKKFLMDQGLE